MWAEQSTGGQGALGPASGAADLEPGRVADRTLPRKNTARAAIASNLPSSSRSRTPPGRRGKHLFLSQLGKNEHEQKAMPRLFKHSVHGKPDRKAEIVESSAEQSANDRQLSTANPVFTPAKNKGAV